MARFLIGTTPLIGHVIPALPIAAKLVERGHEVWWYTGGAFQARVEAAGARFALMNRALEPGNVMSPEEKAELDQLRGLAHVKWVFKHLFIDCNVETAKECEAILRQFPADVFLTDSGFIGAVFVHERGGPPNAVFTESVLTAPSRDTAPFGMGLPPDSSPLGRLRNRLLYLLMNRVIFRDVTAHLDDVRVGLGLPRLGRSVFDTMGSPYLILQGTVPDFEYPRSDLSPQVHFIGPLLPEPPATFTPPAWWDELRSGYPVVHVTQGTVALNFDDLIVPTLRALATEEVLVVVTTGDAPVERLGLEALPQNTRIEPFLPYYHLLPHVNVMISNGGYGGVQQALANGVPLVIAGQTEDKVEIAARVAWAGAGINLKTQRPTPDQLQAAVRRVMTESRYRHKAQQLQAEMASHDAPAEAVALLEQLALTRQPVLRSRQVVNQKQMI